jgi:hypothetical protein
MSDRLDELCMKKRVAAMLVLVLATSALGAGDGHDAQVAAAAGDAVCRMRADIESQPLGPALSVGDFLRQTQSTDELTQALRHADQIGGPRWIDDQTCQVKLSIGSRQVRDALVKIADESGKRSPLPSEAIAAKLAVWDDRTFNATGTSISSTRAQILHPIDLLGAWHQVSDDARKQAIAAARDDAVDRIMKSIEPIELSEGKTVSQALEEGALHEALRAWLVGRPVTRLEFRNDLSIEITLAADGHDVYEEFVDLSAKGDMLPKDSLKLAKIRREFVQQIAPAVGSARATRQESASTESIARIPRQAPAWLNESLNTQATEHFRDSRLKTARAAEDHARELLHDRINALALQQSTIGEAARHEPAVERAVQQALERARAYKIDYLPDGSATVKVSLDPHDLWDELRELP